MGLIHNFSKLLGKPKVSGRPKPIPKPTAEYPHLYFITSSWLEKANQPSLYWKRLGFNGLVIMVDDTEETRLFSPKFNADALVKQINNVRLMAGDMDIYLSFYCTNNYDSKTKHLVPWEDDAKWEDFTDKLYVLGKAARSIGAKGVLMDAENYAAYIGGVAGKQGSQDPAIAWTDHPLVTERAKQFVAALPRLILGHYVTFNIEKKLVGYVKFWKQVASMVPSVCLYEDWFTDYIPNLRTFGQEIKNTLGCDAMMGLDLKQQRLQMLYTTVQGMSKINPKGLWFFPWKSDYLSVPGMPQNKYVAAALNNK